ncbi:MAG: hypothetical protein CVV13_00900 [Gammaproteobacteria bacterium HGW-Gammaproteobacteria-3]|nr:MAG: hypothetical protein CVV13_00900 [Gammaproteobacteria bacterium HGW-Gammaproteobacteria-3]
MIGGVVMILVVLWIYHSAVKAKVDNVLLWVAVSAGVFLAVQYFAVNLNIFLLDALKSDIGANYERDLTSIGDRKNKGGFQGFGGGLLSVLLELLPPLLGVLAVALIRTKLILKEALTVGNLFSGMKDVFITIKNSFQNN